MKKIIFFIAFLAFQFLNAQTELPVQTTLPEQPLAKVQKRQPIKSTKFGVKCGINFSTLAFSGNVISSPSKLIKYYIGVFAEFKINEKFSIQPELIYSTQGSSFDLSRDFGDITLTLDTKFDLDYINLPVTVKYYPVPQFCLELGPQIGYLANANFSYEGTNFEKKISTSQPAKNLFTETDFGLNIGFGFHFLKRFSINGRYNIGLSDIAKGSGSIGSIKNRVFSLSLALKF